MSFHPTNFLIIAVHTKRNRAFSVFANRVSSLAKNKKQFATRDRGLLFTFYL